MNWEKIPDLIETDILCNNKIDAIDYLYADSRNVTYHQHDAYEFFLLLKGDINFYSEQVGFHVRRGDLICIPPYLFHTRDMSKTLPYERVVINLKESVLQYHSKPDTDFSQLFKQLTDHGMATLHMDDQEISQYTLASGQLEAEQENQAFGKSIMVEALIQQILVMVGRNAMTAQPVKRKDIMPPLVVETLAYIEQHLGENITMDGIAEALHHNALYLGRCFKAVTGVPIKQFVITKRLSTAKRLMSNGSSPSEACFKVGYNDYSNFSRTFTKRCGISPRHYAEAFEQDNKTE